MGISQSLGRTLVGEIVKEVYQFPALAIVRVFFPRFHAKGFALVIKYLTIIRMSEVKFSSVPSQKL